MCFSVILLRASRNGAYNINNLLLLLLYYSSVEEYPSILGILKMNYPSETEKFFSFTENGY